VSETLDPIDAGWKRQLKMNPNARESIPAYAFRRCCEDLEERRHERRIVRSIYVEAKRTNAKESMAIIESWLPRSRVWINRLSAKKTRLRRKLDVANAAPVLAQ
jgi:hypothetical protein